jgi:hypothetical protein
VNGPQVPDGFVPLSVEVSSPENVAIEEPLYPATRLHRIEGVGELPVLHGEVEIAIPIVSKVDTGMTIPLDIEIQYQACTNTECMIPRHRRLRLEVPVVPLNQPRRPKRRNG